MVTRSPSLRQVLDMDLVLHRTQLLFFSGSCFLQFRPGTVRVSLVKVLLEREGTLRATELGIDYVFGAQSDVTSCAL